MKFVIYFTLDCLDESVYSDFKNTLIQLTQPWTDLSFSPLRPDSKMKDYAIGTITGKITSDHFELLKNSLADYFDEFDEEYETYRQFATMCHPNLYHLFIRLI